MDDIITLAAKQTDILAYSIVAGRYGLCGISPELLNEKLLYVFVVYVTCLTLLLRVLFLLCERFGDIRNIDIVAEFLQQIFHSFGITRGVCLHDKRYDIASLVA